MRNVVVLGYEVQDKITLLRGIAIGRVEYITGCAQILVQPQVDEKGSHVDARWFDETRTQVTSSVPVVTIDANDDSRDNGADIPAPIK